MPFASVEWGEGRKDAFVSWMRNEIYQTSGDREDLERSWENAILQWRAKVTDEELDYPYPGAPYSRDTEILTRTGWKRIDAVEVGEYVLTRQDKDGVLEWNPVQAKPSVWAPTLLHLESQTVDLMVTPGHTMVLENQKGEMRRMTMEDMWGKEGYWIPLTGDYEGTDTEELFGFDAGDVSEFIGWYIAEGSGAGKGSIHLAQTKPHGRRAIEALLQRLGFGYSENTNGFVVHVSTMPDQLVFWLDMGVCDEKRIPGFFYGASPRLIKRLFEGMIAGDGTVRWNKGANHPQITYYTTSSDLADDFQAMAQLLGKRSTILYDRREERPLGGVIDGRQIAAKRKSMSVGLLHNTRAKIRKQHYKEEVEYNDFAYCVTVKNHAVYVRRNGKPCWCGNSNLELPLTDMHATPVLADFLQTFHAAKDYWTPTPNRRDTVDLVTPLREGMTAMERRWLKMRRVNERAFLENGILGSAFYKNHWHSLTRRRRSYAADGESTSSLMIESHPRIEHVPIQRVWFPASAYSLDFDAPGGTSWIGHEFRWTPEEWTRFKQGSQELPGFDAEAADVVSGFLVDEEETIRDLIREEDDFRPFENLRHKVFETWARFDTRGDGVYEDIVVTMHPTSGKVLRAIYFPNAHGRHPFHGINYLPGYGIYGIGLAEVDEWAQEASTQLLNAQIDNARLANTRMFSAPIGSMHAQDELIHPGKVWYLEPDESIGEVRLSELYPSGFNLINSLVSFSEMRTGVSELRQGSLGGLPSRTPATSLLSIMREGNKRFDMIHGGVRDVHSEMGLRMLQNVAQRVKLDPMRWQGFFSAALGPEDASKMMSILNMRDVEMLPEAFGIDVSATSASVNKEVEKQSFVGMLQIAQQIYGALVQTAMLMAQVPDETVKATAAASYASGVEILNQLFDRFEVQNKEEHLGNLEAIANSMNAQSQPGGNAATAGLFQQQGLGVLGGSGDMPPQAIDPRQLAQILGMG